MVAGRYRIIRLVGEGGMGAVFEALQVAVDRRVALKVLRPDADENAQTAARFHQEMRATGRIEHPNTIRLYDFGETEQGELFLAMEFLPGISLREAMAQQAAMPPRRAVRIALQIAHGVGAGHQLGIVHRDLKPDNVMLLNHFGEPDFVKVLDFGIARSLDDRERPNLTRKGAIIGTPAYMSPEQATGKPVDARTDLYAIGIMLYEMLTGDVPFRGDSTVGVLVAQANQPPPPIEERAPAIEPALARVVMQLLAKNPDDRFADARTLAAALTRAVPMGEPAAAGDLARAVPATLVIPTGAPATSVLPALPVTTPPPKADTTATAAAAEIVVETDQELTPAPGREEFKKREPRPPRIGRGFWLTLLLTMLPLSITLFAMRPLLSQSAQTGFLSRLPFVPDLFLDTWTARQTLHCDRNQELRIRGVTATLPGRTGVRALDNCTVTLEHCSIEAATAIEASDNARVYVIGGHVTGTVAALRADGNARIDVQDAEITGPIDKHGQNARITGIEVPRPTARPANPSVRRP